MSDDEVDKVINAYREALQAFINGDPVPVTSMFSARDDVTLANPPLARLGAGGRTSRTR